MEHKYEMPCRDTAPLGLNQLELASFSYSTRWAETPNWAHSYRHLLLEGGNREPATALATTILQDLLATLSAIALTKSVGAEPAYIVRLIRTLHDGTRGAGIQPRRFA